MSRAFRTVSIGLATTLAILAGPALAEQPAPEALDPKAILESLERAFVSVAERVTPAVVHIDASQTAPRAGSAPGGPALPPEQREFERRFREFFGEQFEHFFRQGPRRRQTRNQGSGVIVDPSGVIVTNNHLIEDADEIVVRLSDGRKLAATIVGRDPKTDLAVLKIDDADQFPAAELGNSDEIRIGQWAIAVGNPFGLDRTVTVGIISATGRQGVGVAAYESFIQTDAAINPGNSGGPLLNLDGKVIGINTAIVSVGQGIGFAIPAAMVRRVTSQLLARGRVTRGWLGIRIQPLTEELAPSFGAKEGEGVLVADVMPGSPAEVGGLKSGDVILEFRGEKTAAVPDLQRAVADALPDSLARVVILRDGARQSLEIKIGEMPSDEPLVAARTSEPWGLSVQPLTPELARQFDLTSEAGVLVTQVEADGTAARAGIRPGDVILEVNRHAVQDVEGFQAALGQSEDTALLLIRREGRNQFLVLNRESR